MVRTTINYICPTFGKWSEQHRSLTTLRSVTYKGDTCSSRPTLSECLEVPRHRVLVIEYLGLKVQRVVIPPFPLNLKKFGTQSRVRRSNSDLTTLGVIHSDKVLTDKINSLWDHN